MSKNHIFEGKLREFETTLLDYYKEVGKTKAHNPKFASILGYLAIHGSLTQKQLKDLTGFSLATVSNYLNLLTMVGYVTKRMIKGSNESIYILDMQGFIERSSTQLKVGMEKLLLFFETKINELSERFKDNRGSDFLKNRILDHLKFLRFWFKILEGDK